MFKDQELLNELTEIFSDNFDQFKRISKYKFSHFNETFCLLKYTKKTKMSKHSDTLFMNINENKTKYYNAATIMIYLNDIKLGGDLYFEDINLRIKPQSNRIVVFSNTPKIKHESTPVWDGDNKVCIRGDMMYTSA